MVALRMKLLKGSMTFNAGNYPFLVKILQFSIDPYSKLIHFQAAAINNQKDITGCFHSKEIVLVFIFNALANLILLPKYLKKG